MKKALISILLIFITAQVNAQLIDPNLSSQIVDKTMTLPEAKHALQVEVATINYHYYRDKHNREDERSKYARKSYFSSEGALPIELKDAATIEDALKSNKRENKIYHSKSTGQNFLNYNYDLFSIHVDTEDDVYGNIKAKTTPKIVYYADGTTESDSEILRGEEWFSNRKYIDSILVDVTFYYPKALKVETLPFSANKKDLGNDSFIWFVNYYEEEFDMIVTDDIYLNTLSIACLSEDGVRKRIRNSNGVDQPSTQMFDYVSKSYQQCQQLIANIDAGKYKNIQQLVDEYDSSKPPIPRIQAWYKSSYQYTQGTSQVEYTYVSQRDSLSIKNRMCYSAEGRTSDYVVINVDKKDRVERGIADLAGNMLITEIDYTIADFVGLLFTIVDNNFSSKKSVVVFDPKEKTLTLMDYKIDKKINDLLVVVVQDGKLGIVDRNAKMILSPKYLSIDYNIKLGLFAVRLDEELPKYQLYRFDGKLESTKMYDSIHLEDGKIVLENGGKIETIYR